MADLNLIKVVFKQKMVNIYLDILNILSINDFDIIKLKDGKKKRKTKISQYTPCCIVQSVTNQYEPRTCYSFLKEAQTPKPLKAAMSPQISLA